MKKSPRLLLWFIILLTLLAILINLPSNIFPFTKSLSFKKGLDLAGGTSITLKADMRDVDQAQRNKALESVKTVIERRTNYFGVSEPIVQTAVSGNDYRVIVELPGVNIDQAKSIIGTTAQLSFWELGSTDSAKIASPSAYPLGILEVLGPNAQKTNLSGRDLKDTSVGFNPNTGKPEVQLKFTSEGAKKFADITKRNVGKPLAMVLDNQLIDRPPIVNEPILTGEAVISGDYTTETANTLSTQLNAGALPVPLLYLQQYGVDATLGSESLGKSLFAGFLGVAVIIIFMSILYGKLGVLASVALIIYTLLLLSIFKISSITPYAITLTLAGIAGFILSVGMAVDANILIFERMKEERMMGRKNSEALSLGFARAWTSIRDSNIASLITSFVLYQFGTGIVRGFALVLAIGIIVSMFSAIVVTRTLLRLVIRD